jgi:hypothetical protein
VFVGIDTNNGSSEYLDITMQGVAGGWLAVGFSFTQNMVRRLMDFGQNFFKCSYVG